MGNEALGPDLITTPLLHPNTLATQWNRGRHFPDSKSFPFIVRAKPHDVTVINRNSIFSPLFEKIYDLNLLALNFDMLASHNKFWF